MVLCKVDGRNAAQDDAIVEHRPGEEGLDGAAVLEHVYDLNAMSGEVTHASIERSTVRAGSFGQQRA